MFDDHRRICCRSQDSAGKGAIKGPYFEDQEKSRKIPKKNIFPEDSGSQKEESRGARGPLTPGWRGQPLAAPALCVGTLAHIWPLPFAYIIFPENLSQGGSELDIAASAGRRTPEREKLSGRKKSAREIPSQRGEIAAIVIIIASDFIGIIIIISITSTFISTITTPSHCNILSWILLYS
jgi:hypothetical protein